MVTRWCRWLLPLLLAACSGRTETHGSGSGGSNDAGRDVSEGGRGASSAGGSAAAGGVQAGGAGSGGTAGSPAAGAANGGTGGIRPDASAGSGGARDAGPDSADADADASDASDADATEDAASEADTTCVVTVCEDAGVVRHCGDCIDNDGDGLVDLDDPDCLGDPCHLGEWWCPGEPGWGPLPCGLPDLPQCPSGAFCMLGCCILQN
jgi:hypothetical protein